MSHRKKMLILFGSALIIGILGAFCVYRFFPQYLCYSVYDVKEGNQDTAVLTEVAAGAEYKEYFTPTNRYLKSISIHMGAGAWGSEEKQYIKATLYHEKGRKIETDSLLLEDSELNRYVEFSVEKWMKPGEQYQLVIEFPECTGMYVTFMDKEAGPAEHIRFTEGEKETDTKMCFRYTYGNFSKKLLVVWFLAFFAAACLFGEYLIEYGRKQKRISGDNL